ncbi:MAG: PQQ-binding-like beta-propeller repeat protein [Sediminicola sp.]
MSPILISLFQPTSKKTSYILILSVIFGIYSCTKDETKSTDNQITSFQLTLDNIVYDGQIDQNTGKIAFSFDNTLPISLTPSITYPTTALITPSESGPQNFNNIIRYTVTAENGAEKAYTVITQNTDAGNMPPGTMELVDITYEGREVIINWTDALDADEILYKVFKNAIEVGEYSVSEAKIPFTYNQTEKIEIFATDKKGGTSKLVVTLENPKSELLFVKNSAGILYAIDTKMQDILWVVKSIDGFFAPVLNGNEVLISWDKKLMGVELLTGKEVKMYDSIVSNTYSRHGDVLMDTDLNAIYYKNGDGNIYSIDADNGNGNWKTYLSFRTSMVTPTKITENNLYSMNGENQVLYSIDKFSGNLEWSYDLKNGSFGGVPFRRRTPTVIGQSIFFGDNSYVYSLNRDTGEENWVINLSRPSSFTPYKQELIVVASDKIYGIDPLNGTILWNNTIAGQTVSTPFLENETLYMGIIGNGIGSIVAINANNGDELWKKEVGSSVAASPVVYDGKLYVNDQGGVLYCLNASNGSSIWQMTIGDFVTTSPTFVKGNGDIIVYPKVLGY